MDEGRRLTDQIQARMERDITREYEQAYKEVQAKLDEYLSRFEKEDQRQHSLVEAGKLSMKDYQDWRVRHIGMNKRWAELRDTLAEDLHNANQIAMSIAKGYMPEVYALNHNYGTWYMEKQGQIDTSYTLIDHHYVERLVRENPKLLPDPTPGSEAAKMIARNKDLKWNRNKLQSAIIQGCLQGEGIGEIANRFQRVTDMNRTQALRHARTAVTGAANGGRHDSYVRAKDMGVDVIEEWAAVLDHVTRDEHVDMDGERKEVDQPTFSNGLRFPGDPYGKPASTYNCRCSLISWVKGFEPGGDVSHRKYDVGSFDDWEDAHEH
jgi:SPP1 gp7 family putative phage head morphogenesis protein